MTGLDSIVQAWSDWMWNMSWHVTWLVAVLWLMDRPLKHASARLRFILWSLVLLRLVIPPALALPTGISWWVGDWARHWAKSWTFLPAELWLPTSSSTQNAAVDPPLGSLSQATAETPAVTVAWLPFMFTLWLGFVAAQLAWLAVGWWQVRRWLAHSTPMNDPASQRALASAKTRARFFGQIALHDSGMCATPLVIGLRQPKILLPTAIVESLTPTELETVLVHELTHLARGDGWLKIVQAVLGCLYFFHPAVWLARFKLNQACEEACDEQTVMALSGERRDYAQAIVKAATLVGYQPPFLAMNMLGDALPVKRRLQRILDPALPWSPKGAWRRGLAALVVALILLPGGYPTQATPPDRVRQSGLRTMQAQTAQPTSVELDSKVNTRELPMERQALAQLQSLDFEARMAAYATLETVGTVDSLQALEAAFLTRSGAEQDAAKRALDHVWSIIRQLPSEASQTTRQFQKDQER